MFFNWFKKKDIQELEPSLKVYDEEKGVEVLVSKSKWLNEFFEVKYLENISNNEYIYNLLLDALNYNIYAEILDKALKFNEDDNNSIRSIEILQEIYFNSKAYDEVLNLYDKNFKSNCSNANIFILVLKSLKELNSQEEYENVLYEAIYKCVNNKKIVDMVKEDILSKPKDIAINMMETLSELDNAFLLSKFFAKYHFENDNYIKANEYVLKALNHSNYKKDFMMDISNMLFEYKQYIEFENHILSRFDIYDKDKDFTMFVLRYYNYMLNFKQGLSLLDKMYSLNIFNEKDLKEIAKIEASLINMKFKNENFLAWENKKKGISLGETKYFNIQHPIYYYVLNRKKELEKVKDSNKNILILPVYIDNELILDDMKNKILKVLPINILETLYKNTNMKMQISLIRDDIQILNPAEGYNKEYFEAVAGINKNLKYILAFNFSKNLEFKTYLYNCEDKVLEDVYKNNTNINSISRELIEKLVDKFKIFLTNPLSDINSNKINEKFFLLEFFFDFDKNNHLKKFQLFSLLNESIKNCKTEDALFDILALLNLMKIYGMEKYLEFKHKVYELNIKLNDNYLINDIIKEIMEDK